MASSTAKTSNSSLRGKWRVRTLCAGALLLGGVAAAQTAEDEQRALARAKAQSILAEQRAEKLEALADEQMSAAEAVKAKAAAVASRIQGAESDMSAAESRIALIDRMRYDLREKLAAKQQPAVKLIAALQALSRRPPALALVQPGTVSDLAHVQAVLAGLVPRLRAKTADLRKEIERGKSLRVDAQRALRALELAKDRLSEQRGQLEKLAAEKRNIADQTTNSALIEQDRAMAMGEKARDLVSLLDQVASNGEVRDRLSNLSGPTLRPARPGSNDLAPDSNAQPSQADLPYRLPVAGTLVSGLGEVSGFGVRSRGLTLATRNGAQIVSPSAGQVVFAGPFRTYGNIVILDHGRGWTSVITSIASLDVAVGDSVLQGGPIGRAGDDRPTVTVELRQKNQPVDITRLIG